MTTTDSDDSGVPYPGSDEALARGCTCPVADDHERESRRASLIVDLDCPMHGGNRSG